MSEGNPVATVPTRPAKSSRTLITVIGTAVAVMIAGIVFQFMRNSSSGTAAEQTAAVGKAQVAPSARTMEVAAKVTRGGRSIEIPLRDVFEECMRRVGDDVLDTMVNRAVIQLACEERGVDIKRPEVEQEIVRIAKQFDIPVETWLQMLQTERKITPEQYSADVIWPMLALKKLAGTSVEITDADLQRSFQRHYGPRVQCRMIMCDNVRRANEAWQKAQQSPDDFERLVREYSIESNSRALNGSVPPIARFSGNPELESAAFKLKTGEVSGIIQMGINQYVILKCEGQTEQLVHDIREVQQQLHQELADEKVQEGVAKLFEELKNTSRVDNFWTRTTTGDVRQVSGRSEAGPAAGPAIQQAVGTRPAPTQQRQPAQQQRPAAGR